MAVDRAKIAQMEKALEEARAQLWKEEAQCYEIIMRDISEEEKERILNGLTDRQERILFGLEAPEEPKRTADAVGLQRRRSELSDLRKERPDKAGIGAAYHTHAWRTGKEEGKAA